MEQFEAMEQRMSEMEAVTRSQKAAPVNTNSYQEEMGMGQGESFLISEYM